MTGEAERWRMDADNLVSRLREHDTGYDDTRHLMQEAAERIAELEAERDRLREALELALPWLVKASETGLSSCAEAGRRALVNPDQHSDGCLVEIAIRKAKRALNKADKYVQVTRKHDDGVEVTTWEKPNPQEADNG